MRAGSAGMCGGGAAPGLLPQVSDQLCPGKLVAAVVVVWDVDDLQTVQRIRAVAGTSHDTNDHHTFTAGEALDDNRRISGGRLEERGLSCMTVENCAPS